MVRDHNKSTLTYNVIKENNKMVTLNIPTCIIQQTIVYLTIKQWLHYYITCNLYGTDMKIVLFPFFF